MCGPGKVEGSRPPSWSLKSGTIVQRMERIPDGKGRARLVWLDMVHYCRCSRSQHTAYSAHVGGQGLCWYVSLER